MYYCIILSVMFNFLKKNTFLICSSSKFKVTKYLFHKNITISFSMSSIALKSINTIRALSLDQVHGAKSGHQGVCLGMAPVAHVLWSQIMKYSPSQPKWVCNDRNHMPLNC